MQNTRHRLRHPINSIREPFGTAGLIVACIALVAALGGTALAAAKLNSTQKKEVEKIAKKFAGKPGAPGAAGQNGTNGKDGTNGAAGAPGTPGAAGKSVKVTEIDTGEPECNELGGAEVKVEGSAQGVEVCNGEEGSEGSPWTAGGTLPPNATEVGTFLITRESSPSINTYAATISFTIPLPGTLPASHVHFVRAPEGEPETPGPNCENNEHPGPASYSNPEAAPGYFCVFERISTETEGPPNAIDLGSEEIAAGVGRAGTSLEYALKPVSGGAVAFGTWAVTAPAS